MMKTNQNPHAQTRWGLLLTLIAAAIVATTHLGCGSSSMANQPNDPVSAQAEEAEMQGRVMVRTGTDRSICDASLVFARNRLLGEQTGRPDIARRGHSVSQRLGRACLQRVSRFWRSYQGCASPIAGREVETSVYWDADHAEAFRQYGLPQIASAIDAGRTHWQTSCPTDYAAVTNRASEIAGMTPLPVPINRPESAPAAETQTPPAGAAVAAVAEAPVEPATSAAPATVDPFAEGASLVEPSAAGYAEALEAAEGPADAPAETPAVAEAPVAEAEATPTVAAAAAPAAPAAEPAVAESDAAEPDVVTIEVSAPAVVFQRMAQANELMNAGQYRQALRLLNSVRGHRPVPAVLFNMGICLEHLGEFRRAAQVYNRVTSDPVLGPRAQQRVAILRHMPARSPAM